MCMMCEQEALYDAYLEYVARKEAEAAAGGKTAKKSSFQADAIDDDAEAPDELTVVHAAPTTPKTN